MNYIDLGEISMHMSLPEYAYTALMANIASRNADRKEGDKEYTLLDEVYIALFWHAHDLAKKAEQHAHIAAVLESV